MLQLLQEVNERMGVTIVVITHEMEVVRSIAQNVAVLDHGHLVETGTTGEIFAQPQSEGRNQRGKKTLLSSTLVWHGEET